MSFEPLADPFGLRADPDRYVPRPATELALDALERGVLLSDSPVVLFGPPGIGKTLLLRVLGQRLSASFRSAYLPYPLLTPRELCRWALMELEEVHLGDPEASLLESARHGDGRDLGVLLLIDDADALPLRTAERLFEMFHQCHGDLRIVMAAADQERAERIFDQHDERLEVVRLADPMSRAETAAWLQGQLSGVNDAARARFDEAAIDALHSVSQGLPGPLQSAATEVLRGAPVPQARDTIHALAEIEAELAAAQAAERTGDGATQAPQSDEAGAAAHTPRPSDSVTTAPAPPVTANAPTQRAPIAASEPVPETPAPASEATAPEPERGVVAEPIAELPAAGDAGTTDPGRADQPWVPSAEEHPETHAEPGSGAAPPPRDRREKRRRRKKPAQRTARNRKGRGLGARKVMAAAAVAAVFAGAFAVTLAWPFGGDESSAKDKSAGSGVDVAAPPPTPGRRAPVVERLSPPPAPADATRPMAAAPAADTSRTESTGIDAARSDGTGIDAARSDVAGIDAARSTTARADASGAARSESAQPRPDVAAAPPDPAPSPGDTAATKPKPLAPKPEDAPDAATPVVSGTAKTPSNPPVVPTTAAPEAATAPEPSPPAPRTAKPKPAPAPPAVAPSQREPRPAEPPAVAAAPPAPVPAPVVAPPPTPRTRPAPAPRPLIPVAFEAPEGARIEIDGRSLGEAPLEAVPVRAGRHRIVARLADGSVMQRTVEISAEHDRVIFY